MAEKRPEKEEILIKSTALVLRYFRIFSYPLRADEIHRFCPEISCSVSEIEVVLQDFVRQGKAASAGGFYIDMKSPDGYPPSGDSFWAQTGTEGLDELVQRRIEYNRRADAFLPTAHRMGRFIGTFPFVRAVMVSGSLSKHSMGPDSDIDFFVITQPGRLWLARTLLVLFKKLFLFNSHKYFCVNYFVDTKHLEIEDKNLFTAMETITLLPVYGAEWYVQFCASNAWAWQRFPNMAMRDCAGVPPANRPIVKKMGEMLLDNAVGEYLDRAFLHVTLRFWRRKFKDYDAATFEQAFRSARHISKHHPQHFQQYVLEKIGAEGAFN